MKKALITGITGQDGSYLAELLLEKGYEIAGIYRRSSTEIFERIEHIKEKISLISADLLDYSSLHEVVKNFEPDEIYNLGAQSFVPASWNQPILTTKINCLGTMNLLEVIRKQNRKIKFYQASSSEMFGKVREVPQTEKTPFYPRSPYGISKVFSFWTTVNYRESYGIFASNGILFNHESPRRGKQFVTKKITESVSKIKLGLQDCFELGNLDAKRDWGYAKDYMEIIHLMLQYKKPEDFVIATGETHSVREFVEESFKCVDMDIEWRGEGINEVGINNDKVVVKVSKKFFRPAEVDHLIGDPSKAKKELKWQPKVKFKNLVRIMIDQDFKNLQNKSRIL